jgi:hypothetical protein
VKQKKIKCGVRGLSLTLLVFLSPLLMGASDGCQAFRDSMVGSLESATSAALNAAVSGFFDGFQSNSP